MNGDAQSGYYQTISREFLRRRGSPFFLSPRDLALIAAWKKKKVPLEIILDGIGRAFDDSRRRQRGTKGLGLGFCEIQVERAFAQYRDRLAGGRQASAPAQDKRDKVRKEIEGFLAAAGDATDAVRARLAEAGRLVAAPSLDEGALERIDDEVDALLFDASDGEERQRVRRLVLRDHPRQSSEDAGSAVRTRLVKAARDKYRIPHVSLFYY